MAKSLFVFRFVLTKDCISHPLFSLSGPLFSANAEEPVDADLSGRPIPHYRFQSGVEAYLTNEIQNFIKIVLKVNDFRRETSNTNYEIEINNSPAFQNKTTVKNRENLF